MRYLKGSVLLAACAPPSTAAATGYAAAEGKVPEPRYHYICSLTPVGPPAPSFLPPDQAPPRPYQQLPDMS